MLSNRGEKRAPGLFFFSAHSLHSWCHTRRIKCRRKSARWWFSHIHRGAGVIICPSHTNIPLAEDKKIIIKRISPTKSAIKKTGKAKLIPERLLFNSLDSSYTLTFVSFFYFFSHNRQKQNMLELLSDSWVCDLCVWKKISKLNRDTFISLKGKKKGKNKNGKQNAPNWGPTHKLCCGNSVYCLKNHWFYELNKKKTVLKFLIFYAAEFLKKCFHTSLIPLILDYKPQTSNYFF